MTEQEFKAEVEALFPHGVQIEQGGDFLTLVYTIQEGVFMGGISMYVGDTRLDDARGEFVDFLKRRDGRDLREHQTP